MVIIAKRRNNTTGNFEEVVFPIIDIIPVEIKFELTGTNFNPVQYLWDFGDGNISEESSPLHTYNTYGYHYVVVKLRDQGGTWYTVWDENNVVVLGKLDFLANITKGDKPLEVQFENKSISPTGYQFRNFKWNFGDGLFATGAQGPFHVYREYGKYDVKLSADIEPI